MIQRAEMLSELMRLKYGIAVAECTARRRHSMIAAVLVRRARKIWTDVVVVEESMRWLQCAAG